MLDFSSHSVQWIFCYRLSAVCLFVLSAAQLVHSSHLMVYPGAQWTMDFVRTRYWCGGP
uniref:Uncharacterized protein n=1 Tax=Anguilla anguilla TaxID=7936 RepID=A0A0E9SL44_ANGAN